MLKMTIDNEEVVSKNNFTIKEEMLSPSSTILNNTYPKTWEGDKNYTSRFYYPKDYAKLDIQNFSITPEEAGTTIDINGSATLTDVDTTKESRVLSLKGQTSQTGTPTPDSPVPVNVVSGDNEINICGKNLFNFDDTHYFRFDTFSTLSKTNNVITFVNSLDNNRGFVWWNIPIEIGKQVSISYSNITEQTENSVNGVCYLESDTPITSYVADINNSTQLDKTSKKATITTTKQYLVLILRARNINTISISDLMLEKGSTATTYEPYTGNSYPLYLGGTNLFSSDLEQGSLNSSGEITSSTTRIRSKDFISVKNSTQYTLSGVSSSTIQAIIYEYNNDTYTEQTSSSWNTLPYTFTTNATTNKIKVVIRYSSNGTITPTEVSNIQLENGSVATKYNHYLTTPIELCKIGTYQDYIYKDNGSWYLHKEIGKVVLDGSEQWSRTVRSNGYQFDTGNSLQKAGVNNTLEMYSNYFKGISFNYRDTINESIYSGNNDNRIRILTNVATQSSDFQTWLSTNKPKIYYILATPTTTEITDTTLLEQLNDLESQ